MAVERKPNVRAQSAKAAADTGAEKKDRRALAAARAKALGLDVKTVVQMGNDFEAVEWMKTGIPEFDDIFGGVPKGVLIEWRGPSQSGKSWASYMTAGQVTQDGERVAILNVEQGFYEPRAAQCGIDTKNEDVFELWQNLETGEKWGDLACMLAESGEYALIVIDSATAMYPKSNWEKDLDDAETMMAFAKLMSRTLPKLAALCAKTNTTIILINQVRLKATGMPGQYTESSPGGYAMEFYPHMRVHQKAITSADGKVIGENNKIVGGKADIKLIKSRYGKVGEIVRVSIMFEASTVNPVGEFLFRAMAKGREYVKKTVKKGYQYVDSHTGEISDTTCSKDPVEFIHLLMQHPAPEKRTRGDNSTTAYEYICGRLSMNERQVQNVIEALDKQDEYSDGAELAVASTGGADAPGDDTWVEGSVTVDDAD